MKTYRLPEELGGAEFEAGEFHHPNTSIGRYQYRGNGFALWMGSKLSEVPPPIPAEPEPGAYLLGGKVALRVDEDAMDETSRWTWIEDSDDLWTWEDWAKCWADLGGPGITPQRLVPETPEVELPWTGVFGAARINVGRDEDGDVFVETVSGGRAMLPVLAPDEAEAMAAALISAARAVRRAAS